MADNSDIFGFRAPMYSDLFIDKIKLRQKKRAFKKNNFFVKRTSSSILKVLFRLKPKINRQQIISNKTPISVDIFNDSDIKSFI